MSGRGIRQDCPSCGRLYCAHQEATALATARREGWAQAIEALRAAPGDGYHAWLQRQAEAGKYTQWLSQSEFNEAADYLTDRAAALTEEGGQ